MPYARRRRTGAGAGDLNPLQTPGYSPAQRRILLALPQHAVADHEHVELVAMKQRKASSGVQTIGSPPMRAGLGGQRCWRPIIFDHRQLCLFSFASSCTRFLDN
jgi:hypothetical protein